LAVAAIFTYGSTLKKNVLENIGEKYGDKPVGWQTYLMQFLFLIILACHIPYVFYGGKESFLIIIDETMR
jgi:hypothetical protein